MVLQVAILIAGVVVLLIGAIFLTRWYSINVRLHSEFQDMFFEQANHALDRISGAAPATTDMIEKQALSIRSAWLVRKIVVHALFGGMRRRLATPSPNWEVLRKELHEMGEPGRVAVLTMTASYLLALSYRSLFFGSLFRNAVFPRPTADKKAGRYELRSMMSELPDGAAGVH